jgi:hypothetical protein
MALSGSGNETEEPAMKIIAYTQVLENYGTAETPRWKCKGGSTYIVARLSVQRAAELALQNKLLSLVNEAFLKNEVEGRGDYYQEYLIDWELVEDDYLSDDEKMQLEYEGKIIYPPKDLTA